MTLLTIDTTLVLVTHLLPLATESDSPWALLLAGPAGAGSVSATSTKPAARRSAAAESTAWKGEGDAAR